MNIDQIKAALISGAPTRKLAQVPTPEWASLGLPHPSATGADTPAFFRAMKANAVRAANTNAPR